MFTSVCIKLFKYFSQYNHVLRPVITFGGIIWWNYRWIILNKAQWIAFFRSTGLKRSSHTEVCLISSDLCAKWCVACNLIHLNKPGCWIYMPDISFRNSEIIFPNRRKCASSSIKKIHEIMFSSESEIFISCGTM